MPNQVQITSDGSHTIYSDEFSETYHSINGAIIESMHVFINAGFRLFSKTSVDVLEIGFGTGLNAFLTLLESEKSNITVNYTTLELYPIQAITYTKLNYPEVLNCGGMRDVFLQIHKASWEHQVHISNYFHLLKHQTDINTFVYAEEKYDVIFFDAFSPVTQPELWTQELFIKVYKSLRPKGVLTTYCAKGEVRRNMLHAGFNVERLPGPPGKREILRGRKD